MSNVKKSIRLNVKSQKSIRSNVKCQKSIRSNVKCQKSIRSNVKCKKSIRSNVKCQKSIRIILTERTSGVPPVIFHIVPEHKTRPRLNSLQVHFWPSLAVHQAAKTPSKLKLILTKRQDTKRQWHWKTRYTLPSRSSMQPADVEKQQSFEKMTKAPEPSI